MTTPVDPVALAEAVEKASVDAQLAEFAKTLQKMAKDAAANGFVVHKGEIAAVDDGATPPTCSVNISGDITTLVTGVRLMNNYSPQIGQTCLIGQQGPDIFLIGAISATSPAGKVASDNGWIQATLTNGSHGGNSNGNVYYRRVLDHGAWKMQWQGGWTTSGSATMIGTGDALDPDYRPTARRSLSTRRDTAGSIVVGLDFDTNGTVTAIGGTTAPTGSTGSGGSFSIGGHNHAFNDYYDINGNQFANATFSDSGFSVGSHTHTVTNTVTGPTWISLNGLEYFL